MNGTSVVNADHYEAVEVLKACDRVLVLVISREVTRIVPNSEQVIKFKTFYLKPFFFFLVEDAK